MSPLFSLDLRPRFDYIGRLFSDSDDRCDGVPADLVWEHGRVDDTEALDAEYTEMRVDDARLRRSTNTCRGCLQELTDQLVRGHKRKGGNKPAGTHGVERGAAVVPDEFLDLLVRNL